VALSRDYRELFLGNQVKLLISTCMVHGRLEFLAPGPGTTLDEKKRRVPRAGRGIARIKPQREVASSRFVVLKQNSSR
jgi:hypothetical protein